MLFTHHQHAREHLTVEMALYLLQAAHRRLRRRHAGSPTWSNSREIWIVFDMNPDGGEYDIATGSYRSWRKNRQPNAGIDHRRHRPEPQLGLPVGLLRRRGGTPSSETYRGASAVLGARDRSGCATSCDSRRDRRRAADQGRHRLPHLRRAGAVALRLHHRRHARPDMTQDDHDAFVAIGTAMAATNGYTPEQASDLYITDGTINDWLWGDHRASSPTPSRCTRSSVRGGGFYPPDEVIARADRPQPRGGAPTAGERRLPVPGHRQGGAVLRRRPTARSAPTTSRRSRGWTVNPTARHRDQRGAGSAATPRPTDSAARSSSAPPPAATTTW